MSRALAAIFAYWSDGGWLLIPIAGVLFGIWAYWFRLRNALRNAIAAAGRAEWYLDEWLAGHIDTSVWNWTMEHHEAAIPRLVADLHRTATDGKTARRRFQAMSAWQWDSLKRDLFVLKALTAAAPLLGLLGTVSGMVDTFTAVSRHGADSAEMVARGISSALITTQFGLVAALPGVFGVLNLGRLRTRLLSSYSAIGSMLAAACEDGAAKGGAAAC